MISNTLSKNGTIVLLAPTFQYLHTCLLKAFEKHFKTKYNLFVDYQLYGFNKYDEKKPSIKKMIFEITGEYANGKYLYNKYREIQKGSKQVYLRREFVHIYFLSLKYKDSIDFLTAADLTDTIKNEQFHLFNNQMMTVEKKMFYVGYYLGEYQEVIKTKLILSQQSKIVEWHMAYWENEKQPSLYIYRGHIIETQAGLSFWFPKEKSDAEHPALISVYYGNHKVSIKPYLIGVYNGFDKMFSPVCGEIVFVACDDEKEADEHLSSKQIDMIIQYQLFNKRIIAGAVLPKSILDITPQGVYIGIVHKFNGIYEFSFLSEEKKKQSVQLLINANGLKTKLTFKNKTSVEGRISIIGSCQFLQLDYPIEQYHQELRIIIKADFNKKIFLNGTINGIDAKNNMVVQKIELKKIAVQR